ncbi:MAG: hypothetical protein P0116_01745 [Candidatus Nitrosocosmicus sp.]|nr:hypothetical protein [Candidatus Nitrosocosmicus sp.]
MTIGIFFFNVFSFPGPRILFGKTYAHLPEQDLSYNVLASLTILSILSIYWTNFYQLKKANTHSAIYFLGTPVGCFVVSLSFVWSILISDQHAKIKWRDREYNYSKGISC